MSRFYSALTAFLAGFLMLAASSASEAGVSIFFSFPQPEQEYIVPSRQYVNCYMENETIYHGRLYQGRRVCEYRNVPSRAMWVEEEPQYYYHAHRHRMYW